MLLAGKERERERSTMPCLVPLRVLGVAPWRVTELHRQWNAGSVPRCCTWATPPTTGWWTAPKQCKCHQRSASWYQRPRLLGWSLFQVLIRRAGLPPKRSLCNYDVACEPALRTRTQQETPVRAESPWGGGCKLCAIGFLDRWRNVACLYNYLQASRQHAQRKVRLWVCSHVELAEMQNVIRAFKVHHHGAARLSTSLTNSTCPTSARLGWESTVSRKLIRTVWLKHFQTTLLPYFRISCHLNNMIFIVPLVHSFT